MILSRKPSIALAALALFGAAALAIPPARAAEPVTYLGLQAGRNHLSDWGADVTLGLGVTVPGRLSLERGPHFGFFIGRQTDNARYELEYQAGEFDITAIQLGTVRQAVAESGDYKALTLNAYRTHAFNERITGYVGAGIGWGSVSLPAMGFTGGCNCFAAASKSGLVYQGRIGVEYTLAEKHRTFAQFTLLSLPRTSSGSTPGASYGRKTVQALSVGYRYLF